MAFVDTPGECVYGSEHVLRREVAEYEGTDLCARLAERLGRVVVTVGAGENRQADHGPFHRLTGIDKVPGIERHLLHGRHGAVEGRTDLRRIQPGVTPDIRFLEDLERHTLAVYADAGRGHAAQEDGSGRSEAVPGLDHDGAVAEREEFPFGNADVHAKGVAHGHLDQGLGDAAVAEGPCGHDIACQDLLPQEGPIGRKRLSIRHPVRKRSMLEEIDAVAGLLEFRGYDTARPDGGDAEGHEGRRDVYALESAAHRVLAADGGQPERGLHAQGAQQGRERLAPCMRVLRHALEVLLVGEAHAGPVGARTGDLGAGLDDGVRCAVVRTPTGQVGVVAEGHDAGGVGMTVGGEFLDGGLGLCGLAPSAVRHQHRRAADGRVEHLHEALLRGDVGRAHDGDHALREGLPCGLANERIAVFDGVNSRLGVMPGSGAVDEFAGKVADLHAMVIHPHAAGSSDVRHVCDFYVVNRAKLFKPLTVSCFHYHGHTFLRLADGEFGGVQARVLGRDAVEVYVQAGGELADGDADAAGAEVVGLLDQAGHLRTAEKPLELALLGGVTLLDLAAAGLEGCLGVLLGRASCASDAVAAGAAAEQEDHVAGRGALAADVVRLHGPHDGADLHPLGGIALVVDLADMRGSEAYLVAVAGISAGGLAADHALRQLAGNGVGHFGRNVAGSRDAHGLIDVGAAGERVADGPAEAGRRTSERFNFRRMVVRLVLELEEPLLLHAVHVDIDVDAAGVVLLALLEIVELAVRAQPACADGGELHEAEALILSSELFPHVSEHLQAVLELTLHEGLVHSDLLKLGSEGGMAAVVAPVSIQDA